MKRIIPSTDHLGKTYPNWKIMCKSYGVSPPLFEKRLRGGMDIETALTSPVGRAVPCTDHLGRRYPSRKAMCEAWNIAPDLYVYRLEHGMDVETALTAPAGPVSGGPATDHTGRVFPSEAAMCRFWGVGQKTYRRHIGQGLTKEQALTAPPRDTSVTDHAGRTFPSERAMCGAWGVSYLAYRARRARGADLEAALTAPLDKAPRAKTVEDHTGRAFPSVKAMCGAWGISASMYYYRLKSGKSLEEALTGTGRRG